MHYQGNARRQDRAWHSINSRRWVSRFPSDGTLKNVAPGVHTEHRECMGFRRGEGEGEAVLVAWRQSHGTRTVNTGSVSVNVNAGLFEETLYDRAAAERCRVVARTHAPRTPLVIHRSSAAVPLARFVPGLSAGCVFLLCNRSNYYLASLPSVCVCRL